MKRYKINYESVPHGVISWRHDGLDSVYCEAGLEVRITWQPSAGWGLSEAHYTDEQGNEVAIDTKEMAFTMPESDITIGGTFKRFVVTDWEGYEGGGGGGGTKDYTELENKPSINGVTLQGNKTSEELGLTQHYTDEQIPVANEQGKLVDSGNKFLNSSADVRPYADSEDTNIPTEKFLQKTLHNIELPEADKDAANKKYVDDLISELSGKVLKFKGFISPTAPTGTIKDGSLWYEGNALPITFPINVKTYNATTSQWSTTTSEYSPESLDLWSNLNDDKGYYWFGNGWNMIDDNGRFMYVSTFTGVIGNPSVLYYLDTAYSTYEKGFYRFVPASGGNPEKFVLLNKELFKYVSTFTGEAGDVDRLYFLDTEYDTYKVGFYRFIEAHGTEPAKFVRINPSPIKYVSTFNGVVGNIEDLYYLDTAYDNYEVGFYRFVEATTTEPEKFVILNKARFKYVSTFTGEIGDINRLYYLDTTYDDFKKGFYRYNGTAFVNINPKEFFYVSTFNGVEGDDEALYFLDTNYDEYTVGFYRYIEVEEAGVTVGKFIHTGNPHQLQVTYAKLKEMRDNSMLIAGMQYRITDFVTTTVQADTRSANHPFDIIVTADSANTLNEDACAALHDGDTYFANNDLAAWKLKYCLDNDTSRFAWANATNGKGVVFYMKDEFDNECWYDFKNIQYRVANRWAGLNNLYYFTFTTNNSDSQSAVRDSSLLVNCRCNRMGPRYSENKHSLNFNVLRSTDADLTCLYNVFGDNCYNNLANTDFRFNVLGKNCFNNVFSMDNRYHNFGARCSGNTFHGSVGFVSLGEGCTGNTFQGEAIYVKFGKSCINNVVGENVQMVFFENNCENNNVARLSKIIKCGIGCKGNSTSGASENITFGIGCISNSISNAWTRRVNFGNNVAYCAINATGQGNGSNKTISHNLVVLDGTRGTSSTSKLTINVSVKNYTQYAGRKSDGKLRIWNIADIGDLEEKDNIIDVTILPTTDIDTDALYRLTTTHYYHNDTELTDQPQGYKSLNEEALVADENGLTAIEGETSTTTPWAEVTDAMIATLVSGSLVATCDFGEAGFFKTAADEYDYAGNFSTADTYKLWHNATGEPTDWVEVDSVSSLLTDGETTEDVDGELRANAIIDVTALPTTGIKAKTIYRMLVDRYKEDGTLLPSVPTGYVSNRPAIVIIDENGITDDGTLYAWADLDDDQMDRWVTRNQIREVAAADLMTESTCFKTAANHYVYMTHVTEEEVYELYHNPTATANAFIKIGSEGGSAEVDDVTTQKVDGKLQANAIIEVQTLPATGYKQNSLYRMLDTATQTFKRYYYNASTDPLPETPTFYKGDGEHLVFGADGYTLNGGQGSYSSITQITISVWTNNGWLSETTDFSEAGMFRMPGSLAVYDSTTKLTEEDYVVTAEMDKVFKRIQGGWECISYIQLEKEQYDILSEAQKNDGTLYIVNDEED